MEIVEIKNDNHDVSARIHLDEDDVRKFENAGYIKAKFLMPPQLNLNPGKAALDEYGFDENRRILLALTDMEDKLIDFFIDNTDLEFINVPALSIDIPTYEKEFPVNHDIEMIAVEKPSVRLPELSELTHTVEPADKEEISDMVNKTLEKMASDNTRLEPTNLPYAEGNWISVNIEFKDSDNKIDNHIFSPEAIKKNKLEGVFDDKNVGDKVEAVLKSVDSVFTINQIFDTQLPEIDDDFAVEVSEFDTLEELKEDLYKQCSEQEEEYRLYLTNLDLFRQLILKSEIDDTGKNPVEFMNDIAHDEEYYDDKWIEFYFDMMDDREVDDLTFGSGVRSLLMMFQAIAEELVKQNGRFPEDVKGITQRLIDGEKIPDLDTVTIDDFLEVYKYRANLPRTRRVLELNILNHLVFIEALKILRESVKEDSVGN